MRLFIQWDFIGIMKLRVDRDQTFGTGDDHDMKMGLNLNLIQAQKLIMTPELKQAIEMLQYTSQELDAFLQDELLNNPILQKNLDEDNLERSEQNQNEKTDENTDPYENIDWKAIAGDFEDGRVRRGQYEKKEAVNYANFVAAEKSLAEHLSFQLQMTTLCAEEMKAAHYIIENIGENGYLETNCEDISKRTHVSMEVAENVIQTIQTFDPTGVGARSLEECLRIQLEQSDEDRSLEKKIVAFHLDNLAANRLQKIAKELNVSLEEIKIACSHIRSLEPKPGRSFSSLRDVRYVTPDVYVEKRDGLYAVRISERSAPKLYINKYYRNLLKEETTQESVTGYISKKLSSALKLIRSIEQRRHTIQQVAESIVKFQYDFFEKGPMYLKPLNLKHIAVEIGVHESTVSRAVNGKYLQCAQGLFSMKYFFQSGVTDVCGEGVSAESIKTLLKEMIQSENPEKPLSDQKISNTFGRSGIKVSRRTIAKYRDELGISSTSKRKRY